MTSQTVPPNLKYPKFRVHTDSDKTKTLQMQESPAQAWVDVNSDPNFVMWYIGDLKKANYELLQTMETTAQTLRAAITLGNR